MWLSGIVIQTNSKSKLNILLAIICWNGSKLVCLACNIISGRTGNPKESWTMVSQYVIKTTTYAEQNLFPIFHVFQVDMTMLKLMCKIYL